MFALASWELNKIATCVWNLVAVGDLIFARETNKKGIVVEKNDKLWIDWGEAIKTENPDYILAT